MTLDVFCDGEHDAGSAEEILGIIEGMDAHERQAALITAVVRLSKRVETLERAIAGASGALSYPSAS